MSQEKAPSSVRQVAFLLLPEFSMMAFAAAIEPLRAANRLSGQDLFRWLLLSSDGQPVTASNGVQVNVDRSLAEPMPVDMLVACAGINTDAHCQPELLRGLRAWARQARLLGGVCTGSVVLARAGLLDGYRCTIHWEDLSSFAENFNNLEITGRLYEVDRDRFTCSGGIAPLDMMISMIAKDCGRDLAARAAELMIHHMAREAHEPQRLSLIERTGVHHPKLLRVIEQMEEAIDIPRRLEDLAAGAGLSPRQMERLFQLHFGRTPKRYYLDLRLARARHLLLHTSMPITQVGLATGFSSAAHFIRAYRFVFGRTPKVERNSRQSA